MALDYTTWYRKRTGKTSHWYLPWLRIPPSPGTLPSSLFGCALAVSQSQSGIQCMKLNKLNAFWWSKRSAAILVDSTLWIHVVFAPQDRYSSLWGCRWQPFSAAYIVPPLCEMRLSGFRNYQWTGFRTGLTFDVNLLTRGLYTSCNFVIHVLSSCR